WRKPVGEPYPAPYLLKKFNQYGVEVTTASDAHRLGEVSMRVSELRGYLTEAGYDSLATFRDRKKSSIPIVGEG
ncbi:MAG: histidinol phosphatase, partial [Actinomycetota bacterium]|nr:histidinol phosphatase [Actinomycetota bacterium]